MYYKDYRLLVYKFKLKLALNIYLKRDRYVYMKSENKSISNDSIHFIQLKLFDFMDGKSNFDETLNKRLNQESSFLMIIL